MSRWLCFIVVFGVSAAVAVAQEEPKPEQLKTMYADALLQLKAAQDRKNEMAAENEKLNAKITDLNRQLHTAQEKLTALQQQAATYAERTYFLRSYYAAWQEFLTRYPNLKTRWEYYLRQGIFDQNELPRFVDPEWPWGHG